MAPGKRKARVTPAQAQQELIAALERTLEMLERAHADAAEGATHEEAKPEDDKDTRALEQSYLARGQALRIAGLKAGLAAVRGMSLSGALLEVEEDGETRWFFLAPDGGGSKLPCGAQVVTPSSPLGRALAGKEAGDEVELPLDERKRELSILRVW